MITVKMNTSIISFSNLMSYGVLFVNTCLTHTHRVFQKLFRCSFVKKLKLKYKT